MIYPVKKAAVGRTSQLVKVLSPHRSSTWNSQFAATPSYRYGDKLQILSLEALLVAFD